MLALGHRTVAATQGWGLYVMDRGGDRSRLYAPLLKVVRGRSRSARDLACEVRMRYAETPVREAAGGERKGHWEYGFRSGHLPRWPGGN